MPDGPFKSMTREKKLTWRDFDMVMVPAAPGSDRMMVPYIMPNGDTVKCDKCGGVYREGDWPWCKGNPEDHWR